MSYLIVTVSVLMFGINFLFSDKYQKESGSGAHAALVLTFLSSISGGICLLLINGFELGFTPFTLVMSLLCALDSLAFTFCSLKSLEKINLSLYSLFSMIGGMLLPFLVGIIFFDEALTLEKIICVFFIAAALALTVNKENRSGGWIYYIGIFVLNGMSGVLSKIFDSAPFAKTSAAGYSMWIAITTMLLSGIVLVFMRKGLTRPSKKAVAIAFGGGALNRIANFLLLIALASLPASAQYPFVTGGVMIVSTAISAIMGQKPSRRDILAVALAFIGIMALVLPSIIKY